jgi:hypothetical protein
VLYSVKEWLSNFTTPASVVKPKEFFVVLEYRIHIVRRQSIGCSVFDAKRILRQNQLAPKKQCYQGFIWQQA